MKALVTGVSGIGKFVANSLRERMEVVTHSLHKGADVLGDLTNPKVVKKMVQSHGPFNVFVACQGGKGSFEEAFQINLMSVVYCCEEIIKDMPEGGRIVTVGSYAGCFGCPTDIPYSTAKAALHQYTRCLAAQLRPKSITVNCVAPGNTLTERFLKEHEHRDDAAQPEEVASVIAFLCSPEASQISGQIIRIDGGKHTFPC